MRINLPPISSWVPAYLNPFVPKAPPQYAPLEQNPALSPQPHSRVTNALWNELNRTSKFESRKLTTFTNMSKQVLRFGMEYCVDLFHKTFTVSDAQALSILITAGGTKEGMDKARLLTNVSSGAFGRAIANLVAWRGHHVVLIAPKHIEKLEGALHPNVEFREFSNTASLQEELEKAAKERKWDLTLQSAAVSDFKPEHTFAGKIDSKAHDELILKLVKTPKLLAFFKDWFPNSFKIGFKLLVDKPDDERLAIGKEQIVKYGTQGCVENDLTNLKPGRHKCRFITADGTVLDIPEGTKFEVAANLFNYLEKAATLYLADKP